MKTSSFITQNLNKNLLGKGYKSDRIDKLISTIEKLDRNEMLKEKVREKPKQTCIPLTLICDPFCLNISKMIRKH